MVPAPATVVGPQPSPTPWPSASPALPPIVTPTSSAQVPTLAPSPSPYDDDRDVVTGTSTWSRSPDNGRTWSDPVMVEGCRLDDESRMVIGAGGRPYVVQNDEHRGYDLLVGTRRQP